MENETETANPVFTDSELSMVQEALESLRKVKITALAFANNALASNPRMVPFSKADFGVDVIDSLLKKIGPGF